MKQWYWIIDVEKCENCNNCFLSCKDEHVKNEWQGYSSSQPDHGQKWMNIKGKERGKYPYIDVAYLPVPCMHCDNAPCIKAAGNEAIYKRKDGIVIIEPIKARGQKQLVSACPYGAIWWNEELQIPQKCTMCAHLLDDGWTKSRCVQACPTDALSMLNVEKSDMEHRIRVENLTVYNSQFNTAPRVYYKNLYRFTHCFIGGTLSVKNNNVVDCVEGATVKLFSDNKKNISECLTDNYGDFKFDGLTENSGNYIVQIEYNDFPVKRIDVSLKTSVYLGVIEMN